MAFDLSALAGQMFGPTMSPFITTTIAFAFLAGLSVAALAYMLGQLVGRKELVVFAKEEMMEVLYGTLIFFLLLVIVGNINLIYEPIINTTKIVEYVPTICAPGSVYVNYVYDVSPAKEIYRQKMVNAQMLQQSKTTNILKSVVGGAYIIQGMQKAVDVLRGDSSSVSTISGNSIDKWIEPKMELFDPETGKPNPYPCHIAVANVFLDTLVWNNMIMFSNLVDLYDKYAIFGSVSLTMEAKSSVTPYLGLNPTAHLEYVAESIRFFADTIGRFINLGRLVQAVLLVTHIGIYPILLSTGLVLRSFFLTRKLGGLLMAIALGLYLVLPLFFNLFFVMFSYVTDDSLNLDYLKYHNHRVFNSDPKYRSWFDTNSISYMFMPSVLASTMLYMCNLNPANKPPLAWSTFRTSGFVSTLASYAIYSLTSWIKIVPIAEASFVAIALASVMFAYAWSIYLMFQVYSIGALEPPIFVPGGLAEITGIFILYNGIMLFFAVLGTVVFIKNLSPLFGGDTDIAGLTRII